MVVDHRIILSEIANLSDSHENIIKLRDFQRFVQDLLSKIKDHPSFTSLKISDLATNTGFSFDTIRDYLETIKLNFELYQALKTVNPKKKPTTSISLKQLQTLSDFYYISSKFPLPHLSTNAKFQTLATIFPIFFTHSINGWQTSPIGQSIAQQALAFQRLNTYPQHLQCDDLDLQIQDT
jgi:hypothetical protein